MPERRDGFRSYPCCEPHSYIGIATATFLWVHSACAHHSYSESDDTEETIEFEGKLAVVACQFGHVRFMVEAEDENDRVVVGVGHREHEREQLASHRVQLKQKTQRS